MKDKVVFVLIVCMLASCGPEKKVRIDGGFSNSSSGNIYICELGGSVQANIDTLQLDLKGGFSFKRKISQPTFYSLTVENQSVTLLAYPGDKIFISGDAQDILRSCLIEGSEDSQHIQLLRKRLEKTVHLRDSLINLLKVYETNRNIVNIQRQFEWTYFNEIDSLRAYNIRFMEKHPKSLVIIYVLYQQLEQDNFLFDREDDLRYYQRADSVFYRRYSTMPFVNMLRASVLERSEKQKVLDWSRMLSMLGQDAPEIVLAAPNGKEVKLSSTKGKYVLVDFWASWSAPCRTENINLLDVYKRYRDRGFEIFQFSLDQSKSAWVRAIEEDGLPWINVSDFKYWDSEVVKNYGVETIPANFFLDRNGSIMTKNISSEALDKRLDEIFSALE